MAIVSTVVAGYVGSASHGAPAVIAGVVLALAINLALFITAFKWLTATELRWRDVLPGVIVAAVLWQLLQHLGGYYVDHVLKKTGPLYGLFAVVLGLLAWLYLGAQLTVIAAEINVVKKQRLWPRSFFSDPLLDADQPRAHLLGRDRGAGPGRERRGLLPRAREGRLGAAGGRLNHRQATPRRDPAYHKM